MSFFSLPSSFSHSFSLSLSHVSIPHQPTELTLPQLHWKDICLPRDSSIPLSLSLAPNSRCFTFFSITFLPARVCPPVATFQFPARTGLWGGGGGGGVRARFLHCVYRQTQCFHLKRRTRLMDAHEWIFYLCVQGRRGSASHHQELK